MIFICARGTRIASRDDCKAYFTLIGFICARGTRIASRHAYKKLLVSSWIHLRTWYMDCILDAIKGFFNGLKIHLRTWYTDCIGKHAQILLHICRRFYLIVLILADVRWLFKQISKNFLIFLKKSGANLCFSTLPTEQKTEVRTFPFTPPVLSRFSLSPLLF